MAQHGRGPDPIESLDQTWTPEDYRRDARRKREAGRSIKERLERSLDEVGRRDAPGWEKRDADWVRTRAEYDAGHRPLNRATSRQSGPLFVPELSRTTSRVDPGPGDGVGDDTDRGALRRLAQMRATRARGVFVR